MGQDRKGRAGQRERIVCFCYNVSESTLIAAIRGGCHSLMDIRREVYASTGCAGCSEEVKKLLRKYAVQDPESSAESDKDEPGKVSNG